MGLPRYIQNQVEKMYNQLNHNYVGDNGEGAFTAFDLFLAGMYWDSERHTHRDLGLRIMLAIRFYVKYVVCSWRSFPELSFAEEPRYDPQTGKVYLSSSRYSHYLEIVKRNKLKRIIYQSRSFPPAIRHLIFVRDNYTCQICGREKSKLIELGLHLEVDHIKEWEDGGQTCYENGQAICSECNKGKHFAKKYIPMKEKTA